MDQEPDNIFEKEQARLIANLTLQMEKFCQVKEQFFASKFNLTPAEFRCLRAINDSPKVTTKELSQQMKLTPGRITHLLNSLEIKNMVFREIDKSDRRSIQVTLTESAIIFINNVIEEYTTLHVEILRYLPNKKRIEILNNMKFFFMALKDWANDI